MKKKREMQVAVSHHFYTRDPVVLTEQAGREEDILQQVMC